MTYDFHTLGWAQFQDLGVAVLRVVLEQEIETFSKTNDGGQDGTFCGNWNPSRGGVAGTGTVQCKFSAMRDSRLRQSDLKNEIRKARNLAADGRAQNYILITNCGVTHNSRNAIEKTFRSIPGIESFSLYGRQWLEQRIVEDTRLRMLVPRVYGLGDLTQILDERRRIQARAILVYHRDNVSTFVITKAYKDSIKAISENGLVLLLGEPATGKTSIAAALALGSIDRWKCVPTKVNSGREFRDAWNPGEQQFFWVDDAFGATQYQSGRADDWIQTFPYMQTALKQGARIVLTSRTYIFQRALRDLKTSEFPTIRDSKVHIHVEEYTKLEREAILYNHLRLGDQSEEFKLQILERGLLNLMTAHKRFTPVVARRIAARAYTQKLELTRDAISNFVENQGDYLRDMIAELDRPSYGALSLIFMGGGAVSAPLPRDSRHLQALESLGTSMPEVVQAMTSLAGTLVQKVPSNTNLSWRFDHPSIGDALAIILTADVEQLGIYLRGARLEQILEECTCVGQAVQGAVQIPSEYYGLLLQRLRVLGGSLIDQHQLLEFLLHRTDREFLRRYLSLDPGVAARAAAYAGYFFSNQSRLLARLHQLGLLSKPDRMAAVAAIGDRARTKLEVDFLVDNARGLLTEQEVVDIKAGIRNHGLGNLPQIIDDVESTYDSPADPEDHFSDLVSNLESLRDIFADDDSAAGMIDEACDDIGNRISMLAEALRVEQRSEPDDEVDIETPSSADDERDFFADVAVPV